MFNHTKPKIVTISTSPNNLQIVGKKIDEAISTKHLNKSINPTQFDYTFQITEPAEKHVASGGFRVPQGNFGKNTPISSKSNPKINVQEKNLLTKNDIMKNIGIYSDMNNEENEFLEASEPFTDFQYMETIKNRRDMADLVIENIEKNIGKLHLQREHLKEREKSLKNPRESQKNTDNIVIYNDYDRSQIVSHTVSTNEKGTIENVEALLMAHQDKMKEMHHKYLERKIHKIDYLDDKSSRSKSRTPPPTDLMANRMTVKVKHVPLPKNKNKKLLQKENVSENFSFMHPKEMNPQNYEKQYKSYLEKKKKIEPIVISKEFSSFPTENSPRKQKKVSLVKIAKDELELMQFFFDEIPQVEFDMILKEKLIEFLKNNENILDIYDLDPLSLKEELISFQTQFPSKICFKEFVSFLKQPRATKISRTDSSSSKESTTKAKPSENICLLREKDILMFEQIYNDLDRHQDLVIPLKELLYKLKNDVHFARILYEPIVYLTKIDKAINLDRVLYQLEREALTEKERRDKEYISWNYLINFITKYQLKPYIIRQNDEKNVQSEEQIISMDQRIIDIMKDCSEQLPKSEGYFKIKDLIFAIRNVKRFEFLAENIVRTKCSTASIPDETLRDILYRIEKESDTYLDFDEFLEFFTKLGHPKAMLSSNPIERNRVLHNKLQDFLKKKPTRNSPTKNSSPLFKQQRQNINKIQQSSKDLLQSSQSPHKSYINTKKNMNFEERCIENSQETLRDKIDLKNQNLYDNLRNNSQGSPEHKMESSNNNIYGKFRNNSQESLTHDKFWNNSPNLKKKTLSFNKIKSLIYESPKNLKEFSSPKQLKNNGISFQLPTNSDDIDSINPDIFTTKRRYSQSPIFHEERPEQINENSDSKRNIDGYDSDPEYRPNEERRLINRNLNNSFSEQISPQENLKITVPIPFQFEAREKQRKYFETVKEKANIKSKLNSFKANPVPEFVKQRNLLEKINKEQELKREEIKKNSKIITMQREKPFSFYQRDIDKQGVRRKNKFERKKFIFKANSVPWFCSVKLFEMMNEKDRAKREERVAKQAQISLNMAKLPPRMEKHEQAKKAYELKFGSQYNQMNYLPECTFKPKSPKKVPNFNKLQRTFQILLDNKRRNKRPTLAKSPKFRETKRTVKQDNLNENLVKICLETKKERKIDKKPLYQPPSTKKWEAALEKAKQEKEVKEKLLREKEKEENERLLKKNKIKNRVQTSKAISNNTKTLKEKQVDLANRNQEKLKNDKNIFALWKKEMNERISQRPLLVETATNRDKAFEKMKQLSKLYKIMQENGIKNKDIFTEEEKELIGDLEFLKKNNMLKDFV